MLGQQHFFTLRFRVLSSKILAGKRKSLIFRSSKLSFLPRVLASGIDAVLATGLPVWKVGQWVRSD